MQDDCCKPGDVTITPTTGGYRLSKALPGHTPAAPWWEFISIVESRDEAVRFAKALASAGTGRAWFHNEGDVYELVPMEASTTADPVVVDTGTASSTDESFTVDTEPTQ